MAWMSTEVGYWVTIGVGAVLSLVLGYLSLYFLKPFIGLLGAVGGFFLGTTLYSAFLANISGIPSWTMIVIGIVLGVVAGFFAYKFARPAIIITTALIGSYLFMRGCSYIFGGYPDEA